MMNGSRARAPQCLYSHMAIHTDRHTDSRWWCNKMQVGKVLKIIGILLQSYFTKDEMRDFLEHVLSSTDEELIECFSREVNMKKDDVLRIITGLALVIEGLIGTEAE